MRPPKSPPSARPPASYSEAVRGLTDGAYCRSRVYRDRLDFADFTTAQANLAAFCGKLVRRGKKMNVPLYVETCSYNVAFVLHGRRGRMLHPKEWEVIGHLGAELAAQYGLKVRWGGLQLPSCWFAESEPLPGD